jgi:hypothetical protein
MARSTSPHNGSGVFAAIQELTAEFVLDDESQPKWGDGRVIDEPSLPSPGSISGAFRNPVPRGAGLALDRTDRGKAGSSASEAQDFAAEIDSLRLALQRLQLACPALSGASQREVTQRGLSRVTQRGLSRVTQRGLLLHHYHRRASQARLVHQPHLYFIHSLSRRSHCGTTSPPIASLGLTAK